jgi:hypothetical protein
MDELVQVLSLFLDDVSWRGSCTVGVCYSFFARKTNVSKNCSENVDYVSKRDDHESNNERPY